MIVEDEEAINDLLGMNLEAAGYEICPFLDGNTASDYLRNRPDCDLAILDMMLPGKDGFALLPEFEAAGIAVICLTAKGDLASKVRGLKEGAEDYMVKPFEMLELLIRIEKILQRHGKEEEIRIQDVVIYPRERKVEKAGTEIYLKPMEFDCLLLLAKNRNIALSREELLRVLWGTSFEGETRTIDVHIGRIRKKLGFQDVIRTVPRVGYRLDASQDSRKE